LEEETMMLRARDVMNRNVFSVKKNTPIFEAVELMVSNSVSGLPVVNDDLTIVGILSEKDAVVLFYTNKDDESKIVDDFMTHHPVFFEENESLLVVCDFLTKNIFRRVPITSNGKLVGIISVQDVLDCVLKHRQQAAHAT
jgi:CBS domain-containing protein